MSKGFQHVTYLCRCFAKARQPSKCIEKGVGSIARTRVHEEDTTRQTFSAPYKQLFNNAVCALDMQQNHMATIWVSIEVTLGALREVPEAAHQGR
ncbi:hypothetical protein BHYA_0052g00550 [Botrytis hyacinthi]|uniref:Uncharacterized protein n=1 Tax=Botrytis hyacinthi TaxID=278943 RepID=A0A4Z1GRI1_9HELO|nr:hypothetical protein BHYA_0052g00550 [Botrytis hyacinthi]